MSDPKYNRKIGIPDWIRQRFPADPRAMVDFLRPLIDEGMLREIAGADYEEDVESHLAELKSIWSGGELSDMDSWFPREVLELMRWSEPDESGWKREDKGLRGHLMRAFCCAVLLATPNVEPTNETLIQMLDSIPVIGPSAAEAAGRFMVWRMDSLGHEEDRPYFALAVAALLHTLDPEMPDHQEREIAGWMADEESEERRYHSGFSHNDETAPWLFGLSYNKMRNIRWNALIGKLREERPNGALARLLRGKCPD